MKFILPTNEKSVESNISPVFARAYFFAIYDTETKQVNFIENTASSSQGGAGVKAAQLVVDQGADRLIVMRLGENSFNVLNMTDIQVYQTISEPIKNIFDKCEKDQLKKLEIISKGFHHHG